MVGHDSILGGASGVRMKARGQIHGQNGLALTVDVPNPARQSTVEGTRLTPQAQDGVNASLEMVRWGWQPSYAGVHGLLQPVIDGLVATLSTRHGCDKDLFAPCLQMPRRLQAIRAIVASATGDPQPRPMGRNGHCQLGDRQSSPSNQLIGRPVCRCRCFNSACGRCVMERQPIAMSDRP
jgi:hypothetical protein